MKMESKSLPDFYLPFEAYPSQRTFMREAYRCFQESGFGLFESPTGSGKTIAILSSALTWLRDNRLKDAVAKLQQIQPPGVIHILGGIYYADSITPRWVRESCERHLREIASEAISSEHEELERRRSLLRRDVVMTNEGLRLRDGVKRTRREKQELNENDHQSKDTVSPSWNKLQIVICSRTFAQLEQYVREFRRLEELTADVVLGIALGRSHACINSGVRSKCSSNEEFNNECRNSSCDFRDRIDKLVEICSCFPMDIEDLRNIGNGLCSCPYYASLKNIPNSDVILAPYVSVFQDSIRKSLGIRTEGNIIIVDEAHNLPDAITEARSSTISCKEMEALTKQCRTYINRHPRDDKCENDMVETMEAVAKGLSNYQKLKDESKYQSTTIVLSVSAFIVRMELEGVHFHHILASLSSGTLCKKLRSWAERLWPGELKNSEPHLAVSRPTYATAIYSFLNFVSALLSATKEDWVIVTLLSDDASIEIFSLSAEDIFHSIAAGSKSTLLMSGTLSPIEEFIRMVPPNIEPILHRGTPTFSLDRVFTAIISNDEDGMPLLYNRKNRENEGHIAALCQILEHIANIVPNGILCFFSSYEYLGKFRVALERSHERVSIISKKEIFYETKGSNGKVLFAEFRKKALSKGAILFAVYGGSHSEGVDYRDGLARLVLLVGLPYPPNGVKLQLQGDYYKEMSLKECHPKAKRDIYKTLAAENRRVICFKTINQSIGRAMRHKDDYAAIILLDARYEEPRSKELLPEYVIASMKTHNPSGSGRCDMENLYQRLIAFYKRVQPE